jgi:hypothetical protein
MSDREFWRTQPKRLKALLDVKMEIYNNDSDSRETTSRAGFIDQVL